MKDQFASTFVASNLAAHSRPPAALPSQSVIGEINPHAGWRLWYQFLTDASQNVIAETKRFGCSPNRCGPKGWVQARVLPIPGSPWSRFESSLGKTSPPPGTCAG